jgi:hypothetical protein
MTRENGLCYSVSANGSANGSAGEWYWHVVSDRNIIARGVAATRVRARAEAITAAASYIEQSSYKAILKTTTPFSSATEM